MDANKYHIELFHSEGKSEWYFEVYDPQKRLIGRGDQFKTRITAAQAAKLFITQYVEHKDDQT